MMTLQKVREGILKAWVDSYLGLRDQLAAEREKAKQWQSNYYALRSELLEERRLHDELEASCATRLLNQEFRPEVER